MLINSLAGTGETTFKGDLGPATSAAFHSPKSIAVDVAGTIYVADTGNHRIREIRNSGTSYQINTLAGSSARGQKDISNHTAATSAYFNYPMGVAVDTSGKVYVADTYNHVIRVVYFQSPG